MSLFILPVRYSLFIHPLISMYLKIYSIAAEFQNIFKLHKWEISTIQKLYICLQKKKKGLWFDFSIQKSILFHTPNKYSYSLTLTPSLKEEIHTQNHNNQYKIHTKLSKFHKTIIASILVYKKSIPFFASSSFSSSSFLLFFFSLSLHFALILRPKNEIFLVLSPCIFNFPFYCPLVLKAPFICNSSYAYFTLTYNLLIL